VVTSGTDIGPLGPEAVDSLRMLRAPGAVWRRQEGEIMLRLGLLLVVLGLGSLLLPLLNLQFRIMELVDPYQPFAGLIVAAIGVALIYLATQRSRPVAASAATPE
jgi:hypothetical protein